MRALIADDHPMVRDALAHTLRLLDDGIELLEASDFDSALLQVRQCSPSFALLDLNMPGMHGLRGIARLRQEFPQLIIAVASGEDDPAVIREVMALGVAGFLPKSEPASVLLQALRLVLSGSTYLPARALGDFRGGRPPATQADRSELTPRQLEVLERLMRGQPNKAIARELDLTEGTVKNHIAELLRALNARNRTEAVINARRLGIGGP